MNGAVALNRNVDFDDYRPTGSWPAPGESGREIRHAEILAKLEEPGAKLTADEIFSVLVRYDTPDILG